MALGRYGVMTIVELQQERVAIEAELRRRNSSLPMSDTPRTDAVLPLGAAKNPEMPHIAIELAGLCREIERELSTVRRVCGEALRRVRDLELLLEQERAVGYREGHQKALSVQSRCMVCAGYDKKVVRECDLKDCPKWETRPFQDK